MLRSRLIAMNVPLAFWEIRNDRIKWFFRARCDAAVWCKGKRWWPRASLLAYLAYAGIHHLYDPLYRSWFAGLTLVIHELGHLLVFAPRMLSIASGSIFQLVAPTAAAFYLLRSQRDYFGFAVGNAWLSFSLWDLATYVDDANKEQLPLVGFGDHPVHDWSYLLTEWHLLNECSWLATATRCLALLVWLWAMLLGSWLCFHMTKTSKKIESNQA